MKKSAASVISKQYKQLTDPRTAVPNFNVELTNDSNLFSWNIGIMIQNEDSIYNGGYLKGQMIFPDDYPYSPPDFKFIPPIYHPNVYKDGRLCISILHQSGDATSGEPDNETWSPVQTAETVLMSIISLLEDPNLDSPANVDAAVDLRKRKELYMERVKLEVERSQQDIPRDLIWPNGYKNETNSSNMSVNNNNNNSTNMANNSIRNSFSNGNKDSQEDSSVSHQNNATGDCFSEISKNSIQNHKTSSFWHDTDAEDEELEVEFSESDEE
ncbi:hypothetical protein QEN19_001059 [Hanseniaspora menglaensis]